MSSFKDKLVFITGGASGIGKAMAESFAIDGATVCIGDISDGTEVAKAIGGAYYKLDVSDEDKPGRFTRRLKTNMANSM